jgi:hypothetical protein
VPHDLRRGDRRDQRGIAIDKRRPWQLAPCLRPASTIIQLANDSVKVICARLARFSRTFCAARRAV